MKIKLFTFLILFLLFPAKSLAVYDPTSLPNNKIGIHILFPDELQEASELVNSKGGEWGYVTIPIQAGDKDIRKWQKFMDEAKRNKLIPILRLATQGDYFQKESWKKPAFEDILDFANFLDSLNWPVKNRYIIVFNEVNRADEWNGSASPSEYAQILSYAVSVFKSKNQDYFIISSGMDNASVTANNTFSQYDFFEEMNNAVPGVFDQIDGLASHSYPNPAFSQPPTRKSPTGINSFIYESNLISNFTNKDLPIFVTETGWDQNAVGEVTASKYFKFAIENVWNDNKIIAITPFLLKAGQGPYEKFSFIKNNGDKSEIFKTFESINKIKGTPLLNDYQSQEVMVNQNANLPIKNYPNDKNEDSNKQLKVFVKWLLLPI